MGVLQNTEKLVFWCVKVRPRCNEAPKIFDSSSMTRKVGRSRYWEKFYGGGVALKSLYYAACETPLEGLEVKNSITPMLTVCIASFKTINKFQRSEITLFLVPILEPVAHIFVCHSPFLVINETCSFVCVRHSGNFQHEDSCYECQLLHLACVSFLSITKPLHSVNHSWLHNFLRTKISSVHKLTLS